MASTMKVETMRVPGWCNVRVAEGVLDGACPEGGFDLNLGGFVPKYAVGVQLDKGYVGYYDVATKKLKVFSSQGLAAESVSSVAYTVTLMGM